MNVVWSLHIIAGMIKGIQQENKVMPAETGPKSATKEDSRMSLSHLVIHGFVETEVEADRVRARFRSLRSREVQEVENQISLMYQGRSDTAARAAKNRMLLAKSLLSYTIAIDPSQDNHYVDLSHVNFDKKMEALEDVSQYVWNALFMAYLKFEKMTNELLATADVKNF